MIVDVCPIFLSPSLSLSPFKTYFKTMIIFKNFVPVVQEFFFFPFLSHRFFENLVKAMDPLPRKHLVYIDKNITT